MAKVIKRGSPPPPAEPRPELTQVTEPRRSPIIDRDTFEARAEGQQIRERAQAVGEGLIADAQAEASQLLDAAREEAEAMRAAAHATGLEEGRREGAESLAEIIAATCRRRDDLEAQLVPKLSTLAVAIARRILGRELEFHPEAVAQVVKQALAEKVRQRRDIVLRLHPDDLEAVREQRAHLLELLSRSKDIALREDPGVARYGVIIETDAGRIDAQLETQLAAFERGLAEVD